jgi:hypothetical protein
MALFISETGHIRKVQGQRCEEPGSEKKKGGAMNAPPLEGSDTSVSSPKRQTAEAVRDDDHLRVPVSQA